VLILSAGDEESSHATGDGQSLPGYALERRGEEGGEVGKGGGWRVAAKVSPSCRLAGREEQQRWTEQQAQTMFSICLNFQALLAEHNRPELVTREEYRRWK
jgi:hypothetical protein